MSKLIIRNHDDAWRAFDWLCGESADIHGIAFENCVMTVDASEPIEGLRKHKGFIALQMAIRRQFCWLKHGSRHLRRLSPSDVAATEIDVVYHPNGRHIRYDLTRPLNALAGVVEQWDEYGPPWRSRTRDLFAVNLRQLGGKVESWPHAARDVGLAFNAGLTRKDKRRLGQLGIVMAALVWIAPAVLHEGLTFVSQRLDASAARQDKLAMSPKTAVVTKDGRDVKVTPAQLAKIETDIGAQRRQALSLISDNIETPLQRFIVAEAETAWPAVLEMAPPSAGTLTVNDVPLRSTVAKAGAKAMRKASKQNHDADRGWVTSVVPNDA